MTDIRKMLERQLETLQDASMNTEVAAECTYAMLAIVDVLYPEGIPEASAASKLVANIQVNTEEIASQVVNTINKQNSRETLITI